MPEEGCETAETDLHNLWHGGLQRLLQNCRAFVVAWMLGENKSQSKICRGVPITNQSEAEEGKFDLRG